MTVNHNRFLEFTKDEKGQLVIEPDEAVVVKRIYREHLEGASLQQIARGLEADGILTGTGKKKWHLETLQKILKNKKYIGEAPLQKIYTVDVLEEKRLYSSKYALSSIVYCSKCGDIYRRIEWNNSGKHSIV